MDNWQQIYSFAWSESLVIFSVLVLIAGLLLSLYQPNERILVRNMVLLFLASLIGLLISGIISVSQLSEHANWVHKLFIFIAGTVAIRLNGLVLFRILLPTIRIQTPSILEDVLIFIAYFGWGLVQLKEAGLEVGELVTTSAIMTAILALAMKDTLGNLLGGVALQWDHSIKQGDWVRINETEGKVVDIRWRAIFIENRDWETVVIPNSILMQNSFKVLGKKIDEPMQWRRWVWFNVDYSIPPTKVISIVEEAINSAEINNLSKEPQPNCQMMNYESSYARYALRYWLTNIALDDPTDSLVRQHLFDALAREGIAPAIEKNHIYLTKENDKQEAKKHEREIAERIQIIKNISLFSGFGKSELHHLANELKYSPFSKGDVITQDGEVDHWLYVIVSGIAGEYVKDNSDNLNKILTLAKGDYFGEMGLMTGEPRTATVIAEDEMVCYRLDKTGFKDLINSRPTLIDEISAALLSDRLTVERAKKQIAKKNDELNPEDRHLQLVNRMKKFFSVFNH